MKVGQGNHLPKWLYDNLIIVMIWTEYVITMIELNCYIMYNTIMVIHLGEWSIMIWEFRSVNYSNLSGRFSSMVAMAIQWQLLTSQ